VSPEIIDYLNQTQIFCRNHKFHGYSSTRAYQFMLLADKKVFYFDDKYSGDFESLSEFEEKYIHKK